MIVHNCVTQCSTEQFWYSSVLSSRQSSQLRCNGRKGIRWCWERYKKF